ncbi:MAG: NADH:flavin oxidoreductase/NADH oxidase [Alphaproteobacteria bacterium]|nr:NADH:flavin oxidoreductase/NADH oxidase [Alphaproteobacteria bacterium]
MSGAPNLFSPLKIRGVELPNRIAIPPMCQYSAHDGHVDDWHLVNLGRFAMGGAGLIFTEATAVQKCGRITHGCPGIWSDSQIIGHAKITSFLSQNGAVPAIQLGHAGRKASMQRPWFGNGPLDSADFERGDMAWPIVGPSAVPVGAGWLEPEALSEAQIDALIDDFIAAARRSIIAGYKIIELHGAHGYLIHSFLSPLSNQRNDKYGGDLAGRMRLAIEVSGAVRRAIPDHMPLFFRISAVDNIEGGWQLEDTLSLAGELAKLGVDVLDCSSSGIAGAATAAAGKRQPGFQVPYAEAVRANTNLMSMAVGLITHPEQANNIIQTGQADLVAVAREALFNPMWAAQAARYLGMDDRFNSWPEQSGWWLERREKSSEFYAPESQNAKEGF